jgi:HSP20 family protein
MYPSIALHSSNLNKFFNDFLSVDKKFVGTIPVNIKNNETATIIEADVPGVTKENIKIDVKNKTLTLTVEQTEDKKEDDKNFIYREVYRNTVSRSFNLSSRVDVDNISANLENGVLKLTLPIVEEEKPKVIEIN